MYLGVFSNSHTSLKIGQHLSQKTFREANSNFSTPKLFFING